MAPALQTIIEDEEEFLADLAVFYEARGTPFDREGKVSGRPISLHKLYKIVMSRGGYDAMSAERMLWRSLVKEFGFGKTHEAVMTFQLKTVYYKNLAAYEISTFWGEEPPPREILEDISAKGGNLRTRTLENYPDAVSRPSEAVMADAGAETVDDEQVTPQREKTEAEEPESATRYPSRQLRQDPRRTQIYQPDTQPTRSRNVRATDSPSAPPVPQQQPYLNGSSDPRNPSFDWYETYDPRPPLALTLRPAQTPSNDLHYYARRRQARLLAMPRPRPEPQQYLRPSIPTAMNGPNIYQRCLLGLRSGVPEEQEFALHHLVKVSYERGDKYKFEGFPYLAEALMEKALEITELVYGVKWEISLDEEDPAAPANTLNAAFGTSNLGDRIQSVMTTVLDEDLDTAASSRRLERLKEAILVIRNMVTLEDNAIFLAKFPLFKDFLTIALALPNQAKLTEYKQSALDILEMVTRYWALLPKDPLYLSLIPYLESADRGMLISALRSITRVGVDVPETHILTDVPLSTIERLLSLILLESDNELVEAALDILYGYTAIPENNKELFKKNFSLMPRMISRFTDLLLYQSVTREEPIMAKQPPKVAPIPATIPVIPPELHAHLLQFHEPERSSRWLRCCFEESPIDDITQIAIWQAYQGRFVQNNPVPAADFIKNVSSTFASAQAQVINGPQPRFIIKGIRPRRMLVDLHGRPLFKCLWEIAHPDMMDQASRMSQRHMCHTWATTRDKLFQHVLTDHLRLERTPEGQYSDTGTGTWACRWTHCKRRTTSTFTKAREFGAHLHMHIPETAEAMSKRVHELAHDVKEQDPVQMKHTYHYTAMDHTNHPCGIPWMSLMVMRNLARFANKHGKSFEGNKGVHPTTLLFGGHKHKLFMVLGFNRTLRELVVDLIQMIEKQDQEKKRGVKREHEDEEETSS